MTIGAASVRRGAPRSGHRGFTFLEVLIAMSILAVGAVAVLSLFARGTWHLVQRKVDARLADVRPEVLAFVQEKFDASPRDALPAKVPNEDESGNLSQEGYRVQVTFLSSPFGDASGSRAVAHVVILYGDTPVRVLPPIPLSTRSTLAPD